MTTASTIRHRFVGATLLTALAAEPTTAWAGQRPEGPRAPAVAPVFTEAADPFADAELQQWSARQRKLKIQFGVSAGLTAAFLLTGVLVLTIPMNCPDDSLCEPYGRWFTASAMFPAAVVAAIPTAVYGVRLRRHNERRPVASLQLAPGGLALRF